MEIVIQSLLQDAARLTSSIHVRYSARPNDYLPNTNHAKERKVSDHTSTNNKRSSYIVIQREYAYLEPVIRSTFQEAQDVQVFTDRRFMERRKSGDGHLVSDRRSAYDRRVSTPMVDILINLNGISS